MLFQSFYIKLPPRIHRIFFLSILSLALSVSLRIQRTFMYSINRVFHYFREQSIEMRFFSTHLFYRVYIFYRRLIIADGQWFHTRKESRWQRETCLSKSERLAVGIFLPAICESTSTRIAHSLRYSQRNEKKKLFFLLKCSLALFLSFSQLDTVSANIANASDWFGLVRLGLNEDCEQ